MSGRPVTPPRAKMKKCPNCDGKKIKDGRRCKACAGTGWDTKWDTK